MPTPERQVMEQMFWIADKEGRDVPVQLNAAQEKVDNQLTGRDIIPKARQEGVSTYFLMRYLVKCLSQRNTRAVIISHSAEATQRLLSRVHYILEHMEPKAVTGRASANEITFPKTDSMFYIGTAGSAKFGRGDTITHLHCSEVAYWPNPEELTTGLFQSVPRTGEIAMESTGNGMNFFYRRCMRAANNESRYRLHFLNWQDFPEYRVPLTEDKAKDVMENLITDDGWEEHKLVEQFGLDAEQIMFRREKLEDMDYDFVKFKQEYPMTLDECFQSTGHSIFQVVNYEYTDEWEQVTPELSVLRGHPKKGGLYVAGADVGGGVGKDNSVIEIFDIQRMEQVAEWASNRFSPDTFAQKIDAICRQFNNAYVGVESNNHGILTASELAKVYPNWLIYMEDSSKVTGYGLRTTTRTKPMMIGIFRKQLATQLVIHSEKLNIELSTFIEHDNGKLEAANEEDKDDRVIAGAIGMTVLNEAAMLLTPEKQLPPNQEYKDPFTLDAIQEELRGRHKRAMFGPQV